MIIKASKSGSDMAGIVNYLYRGIGDSGEQKKTLVLHSSGNLRLPMNHLDKTRFPALVADLTKDIRSYLEMHDTATKLVGHHIISFAPEDLKKIDVGQVAEQYIRMSKIDGSNYIAVQHRDTQHVHVHIVFSKVNQGLRQWSSHYEKEYASARGIAISLQHKLSLVNDMVGYSNTKRVTEIRAEMEDIKSLRNSREILQQARNLKHIEKICEAAKIGFRTNDLTTKIGEQVYKTPDIRAVCLLNRQAEKVMEQGKEPLTQLQGQQDEKTTFQGIKNISEKEVVSKKNVIFDTVNDRDYVPRRRKKIRTPDYKKRINRGKSL
jgi:Relaxase/Mobilisation nuclease domain